MAIQVIAPPPATIAEQITFEEFLKNYDGQYAEWVVGRVEVYMSNNVQHQMILFFLSQILGLYLHSKKLGRVLLAGVPMFITEEVPARQPDLMIILPEHYDRIASTQVNGAADIAIEIVSPESTERDYGKKFAEYEAAGVREYWLLDPTRQQADIYVLGADQLYHRHPLTAEGSLTSTLLPHFTLSPALLWSENLADIDVVALVNTMAN